MHPEYEEIVFGRCINKRIRREARDDILNKQNYYNTIGLQIEDLQTLVDVQTKKCFDRVTLSSLMGNETYRGLRRVIITGCGDSFSAAGSMQQAFCEHSGLEAVSVPDPMEFCRFYDELEVLSGYKQGEVLVIAVSASGGSERIVEILEKANRLGVGSMLISNNPQSAGAKIAKYMYYVETPEGCNSPGLRSYFASMVALVALGAYIGVQQRHLTEERFDYIHSAIVDYTKECMKHFTRIDDQMFDLGQIWKGYEKFEMIGDNIEGASAQFVEEKFIECAGVYATHADSEDWCHINFWLREPESIGTVVMIPGAAPSFDRMQYTICSAVGVGRPVLVVTDANPGAFPEGAVVCQMPKAPELWMVPLMDFIPGSLLASYVAALADKLFFMGRYDFREQKWIG